MGPFNQPRQPSKITWRKVLSTMGPGLMVCFADTDGPCLITAAQSGALWDYDLLMLQIVLIPVLFFAQELTVRLGMIRGKGIVGLLKEDLNSWFAWIVAVPLLLSCVMGLISEYEMIGQTMKVTCDIPIWVSNLLVSICLLGLALSGSYSVAEKVGLGMGLCQVLLFVTMFMAKPNGEEVWDGLWTFPLTAKAKDGSSFVTLITANIGAVIMPWMLAYQQSAICDKAEEGGHAGGVDETELKLERLDTFIGSFLTQGVMAAMLITVAAAGTAALHSD